MTIDTSPLVPAEPIRGTRKRLDHIDAMRPVKQAGVVSTHTLLAFAPAGTGVAVGASLMLLHVTREAFLFVSACMLTYSYREHLKVELRSYCSRRFMAVGVPYLCWTLIYFLYLLPTSHDSVATAFGHLGYLFATGYYQLYYLIVLMEFYVVFPLLVVLLRRTIGHHGKLLVVCGVAQALIVSLMHWGVLPHWMRGFWASREVTSYVFYLMAGMVIALHLDDVQHWLREHVALILGFTVASAGVAEIWYFLSAHHVVSWLGSDSDPFQPIVIPFNVGAIASIYLLGMWLVSHRRTTRTRAMVQSGSDNSYGVYLAQMIFIVGLGWLGWRHLNGVLPWPLLCLVTMVIVFMACVGLTELLARTSLAKPLTGRTRLPWRRSSGPTAPAVPHEIETDPARLDQPVAAEVASGG
jgi:peptidoglycan/LPS O-acetylase OafA/YrhL